MREKLPVKWGCGFVLDKNSKPALMTREGALRYGNSHADRSLLRCGFVVSVCRSDAELHGGDWFRINVAK